MDSIADFEITESLGSNSSFDYYIATAPERLDIKATTVALQVQRRKLSAALMTSLCKHLKAASKADPEYVSETYDIGQDQGYFYIASRHSLFGTLADPVNNITRSNVLEIVAQASSGAHALHEAGICHNDINPKNIALGKVARIANVGILSIVSPGQTLAGTQSSTPIEYKSPAVIQGQKPGRLSDLWSLGITLHRALTGSSVYPNLPNDSLLSSVRHVLNNPPQLSDALRNGERTILERALQANSATPYTSAEELAEDLMAEAARQVEVTHV